MTEGQESYSGGVRGAGGVKPPRPPLSTTWIKSILRLFTAISRWFPLMGEPSGKGEAYYASLKAGKARHNSRS